MAILDGFRLRISLAFVIAVQMLQAVHGYTWWLLFSGLGLWSLSVPVTATYGGAALVLHDDRKGYRYTGPWARLLTAAFLSFFLTLLVISLGGLGVLFLSLFGIFL
ncbi:MAG: hypothetical protein M5U26_19405 [Planctomycetota bacterium]|nr:hypothetical protein [Planctomycetota bacterium]